MFGFGGKSNKAKSKKRIEDDDDDLRPVRRTRKVVVDEYEDEDEEDVQPRKVVKKKTISKKVEEDYDASEDDDVEVDAEVDEDEVPRNTRKKTTQRNRKTQDEEDEDSDSSGEAVSVYPEPGESAVLHDPEEIVSKAKRKSSVERERERERSKYHRDDDDANEDNDEDDAVRKRNAARQKAMIDGGTEMMGLRAKFYKDGMRSALSIGILLSAILLISVLTNVWQFARYQSIDREYFSVGPDGRMTPMVPLNAPFLNDAQLLAWASAAAVQSFTMDAGNYRQRAQEIKQYYTNYGFSQYEKALEESGQIEALVKDSLIMTATPLAVPVIVNRGQTNDGLAIWRIRMPIRISYRTSGKAASISRQVTLTVIRRPISESPFGVGISQFITGPLSANELIQ